MNRLTASLIALALCFAPADGVAQQLRNTGVNADGEVLPIGSRDPNWFFTGGAQTNPLSGEESFVVPLSPLATAPPWVNPGSSAWWISMLPDGHLDAPDGITTFFTRFVLPKNLVSATLSGRLASDNYAEVFVNGVSVLYNTASFDVLTPFTASGGFQPGENTLVVQLNNLPNNSLNPAALVMSDLSIETTVVPEPTNLALLVSAVVGIGAVRYRRRKLGWERRPQF